MFKQNTTFPNKFCHCILLLVLLSSISALAMAMPNVFNIPANIYTVELFPTFVFVYVSLFIIVYYETKVN